MQPTYAYPLVPIANFLSAFLVLIPLPWLLQHWNTGAWTHAIWSALLCLITGVNTVLWSDNVEIKAVIWCDISVRINHAGSLAIITTNFVMARRLCLIMHIQSPLSKYQKTKAKLFDLFVCFGIPLISMGLSWFIQGHRFTITEGIGCVFAYYPTPLYVALYQVWLVIFGALCAIYGCFIFLALIRRRNALREVTQVDPDISLEQLRRVIALGCTECLFTLPCTLYVFILNVKPGILPWKGLGDAHAGFSAIWQYPAILLRRRDVVIIIWNTWVTVFVAVVFFLFFGFSKAMWTDYYKGLVAFAGRFGITLPARIAPARSSKETDVVPPMVFKVWTILGTMMTQSRATGTHQATNQDTQDQPDSNEIRAPSLDTSDRTDLEKGILVTTEVISAGASQEKMHSRHVSNRSIHTVCTQDLERGSTESFCSIESSREQVGPEKASNIDDRN